MFALSRAPVDHITIKETSVPFHFYVANNGGCSVGRKLHSILRREGQSVPDAVPVFVEGLGVVLPGSVSGPGSELRKQNEIATGERLLTTYPRVIVTPSPDNGVELTNQCRLRRVFVSINNVPKFLGM